MVAITPTPQLSPTPTLDAVKRQLWNLPTQKSESKACKHFTLPSGGAISINPTSTYTFSSPVVYFQECTGSTVLRLERIPLSVAEQTEPFYGSTTPLVYMVAVTTVFAWTLIIMLMIAQGRPGASNGRSGAMLTNGNLPSALRGPITIFGPGSRPWLQKVAAGLAAISLTVASVDTFRAAEKQYIHGYMNAEIMREDVAGTLEIRLLRVISDVFLWLAQVQTLIRLFPRHKEKLIIKWFGFLLILLDTIFSGLNSFYVDTTARIRSTRDAIPALSYLFQLSLSLLYAAWVFYYIATKRRYAFYHPAMPNICIIAFLSTISILIPAVFFVADIAQPDVGGWGDYFRWVASAAASVVVWEWVERIEALEREEKKDGILGREVFNEDDMQGSNSWSDDSSRTYDKRKRSPTVTERDIESPDPATGAFGNFSKYFAFWKPGRRRNDRKGNYRHSIKKVYKEEQSSSEIQPQPTELGNPVPPVAPTPASRTDSVDSTVYAIRYHPVIDTPPPLAQAAGDAEDVITTADPTAAVTVATQEKPEESGDIEKKPQLRFSVPKSQPQPTPASTHSGWLLTLNPFKPRKRSPPLQVKQALSQNEAAQSEKEHTESDKNILKRFAVFTSGGGSDRPSKKGDAPIARQPTVIPAPPRGHAWSPDIFRHSPVPQIWRQTTPSGADQREASNAQTVETIPEQTAGPASAVVQAQDFSNPQSRTASATPTSCQGRKSSATLSARGITPTKSTPPVKEEDSTE